MGADTVFSFHNAILWLCRRAGGDFHSRTAMSMYDYVAKAVDSGEVLLEAGKTQKKTRSNINSSYTLATQQEIVMASSLPRGTCPGCHVARDA